MRHKIGLIPHSRPTLGKEEEKAVVNVIRSGNISQKDVVARFEEGFATYIGKKFGVAVSSGLAALHLALLALKIGKNDKVILPSYTCDALLNAVLYTGAQPVITDVAYGDCNITPEQIRSALSLSVKAVIVPHAFGFPARIDEIVRLGVPVIEDCALSVGARFKEKMVGSFGNISIFSFYATKMLTTGEGGMVVTDDPALADFVRQCRDYTGHKEFSVRYNYKMTDFAAAMGIVQLTKLPAFVERRRFLASTYNSLLSESEDIDLPRIQDCTDPVYYRYVVKVHDVDLNEIRNKMLNKGIMCGNGVLQPIHRLLELPIEYYCSSERLKEENLSLPIYPLLTEREIERIVGALQVSLQR